MAFTFINYGHNDGTSALITTITVPKPTNTADGDIMFAFIMSYTTFATTVPGGWTKIGENTQARLYQLYYKIASSEPANYTWDWGATSDRKAGWIATYRGGFSTTSGSPIDVVSNTTYATSDANLRAASMTVTNPNSSLLFVGGAFRAAGAVTYTKPTVPTTDWVENVDYGEVDGDFYATFCSMVWTGVGATGVMNATMSTTLSVGKHAFAVALRNTGIKSQDGLIQASVKTQNGLATNQIKRKNNL